MAENTLNQVQRLVAQLFPHEQAHLLAFLALRMAQVVTATSHSASIILPESAEAWVVTMRSILTIATSTLAKGWRPCVGSYHATALCSHRHSWSTLSLFKRRQHKPEHHF